MSLDTSKWGTFHVGDIFTIKNGKGITKEEIENNPGDFIAVQSGEENNGCIGKIDKQYCMDCGYVVSNEACLTVARSGSAGFVSYQKNGCVVGDSAKILELKTPDKNSDNVMLFLQGILTRLRFKYTYGRKVTYDKYASEVIKLPISDDGSPDWNFMESYMRTLHHKPLTTKNKVGCAIPLGVQEWQNFKLTDLFEITNCIPHDLGNLETGEVPFIGRTATNNGLQGFVDVPDNEINDGNCISLSRVASNVALWQCRPFTTSQHITTFRSKNMNIYSGMFICAMMNKYMEGRFSYGRTIGEKDIKDFTIKLPSTKDGTPDWQFMEDYIKLLPYGDRI